MDCVCGSEWRSDVRRWAATREPGQLLHSLEPQGPFYQMNLIIKWLLRLLSGSNMGRALSLLPGKIARALGYQGFTIPYPKLLGLEVSEIRGFQILKREIYPVLTQHIQWEGSSRNKHTDLSTPKCVDTRRKCK